MTHATDLDLPARTAGAGSLAPPGARAADIVATEIGAFLRDLPSLRVAPRASAAELRAWLRATLRARFDFAAPRPLDECLRDTIELLRDGGLHGTHPRYFGLFNPSVHEAGVWADALTALYNPQMAAWAHAPAASEIERHVLELLGGFLGWAPETLGAHFTTGGSEANHTAVLLALESRWPLAMRRGVAALGAQPLIYVSAGAHHSLHKIARVTGLGEDALRVIPTDAAFRMSALALRARIERDLTAGRRPLMVVATAGTTATGAIDPLDAVADVCEAHELWLHVDGAWGASAVLSRRVRPALAGIDRADSVTWDAHKWLSVPMGAGMLFTRHPRLLRPVFSTEAGYVPAADDGVEDPYLGTLQWSRRFIGLKLFLTLATLGVDGMEAAIEHQVAMGDRLRELLRAAGWIVVNDTPLPVVCFTHPSLRAGGRTSADVVAHVVAGGRAWLSEVAADGGERVLRACITSHRTTPGDLHVLLDALNAAVRDDGR